MNWVLLNPPTIYPPNTDHLPTDPLIRRPNNHRPNDKFMFKRLENMKTFILQNASTTGKIKKDTLVYYLSE